MIRRLFWLAAGVVLGVTGYRRAGRLARSIRAGGQARQWDGRGLARFSRDVRDGMELYLDRHSAPSGPNLGGQQVAPRFPRQAGSSGGYSDIDDAKDGR